MMFSPEGVKIYLRLDATDMRKSIDTLCILIQETLELEPSSGHLFLFCNRSRHKLKALYYEDHCFSLWYRRLESGKFVFPKNAKGHIEMTRDHFDWLLASHRYTQENPYEPIFYKSFS